MGYIGQSPQIAQSRYQSIDDISSSFDGSTTSFALQVGGVSPVPFPIASENCLISVGGVIQEPDGTGTNGFQLTGTNIVFSAAPSSGQSFFGVILAGADYVTAGTAFPDGDAGTPSITFNQDLDTGLFRGGTGITSVSSNNNKIADFGPTAIVFNEDGDNVDFRVEGDTKANLFVVDAGNDKITLDGDLEPTTINGITFPTDGALSGRNRIINGDMRIDQRNAGGVVTSGFPLDRWQIELFSGGGAANVEQVVDSPTDSFYYSMKVDVTTADTSLAAGDTYTVRQIIEGNNVVDLRYGLTGAKTVTASFWVKSNLTGTFCAALRNGDNNRCKPKEYTINSANTWEQKTLTFTGDTSGTWGTGNGRGIQLSFCLGSGTTRQGTADTWNTSEIHCTSNQTNLFASTSNEWYITGVQLEVGEKATPFEFRDFGSELARCQRYFEKSYNYGAVPGNNSGDYTGAYQSRDGTASSVVRYYPVTYKVNKRVNPTVVIYNPTTGTSGQMRLDTNNESAAVSAAGEANMMVFSDDGSIPSHYAGFFHYTLESEL